MRTLEILLVLACAAFLIRAVNFPLHDRWAGNLGMVIGLLLAAQLLAEGWRGPLFPVYTVAVAILGIALLPSRCSGATCVLMSAAGMAALMAGVATSTIRPFVEFPTPDGPYRIGRIALTIPQAPADMRASSDTESQGAARRREPLVIFWYPAASSARPPGFVDTLIAHITGGLRATPGTGAIENAPILVSGDKFPVLLYYPGWPGTRLQNVRLIRELVSHGYTVASVQYPARTPGLSPGEFERQWLAVNRPIADYASDSAFYKTVQANNERVHSNAEDATRILNVLTNLNGNDQGHRFTNRLDLKRIGIFGYSFGGAVAAEVGRLEPRVRSVINIDGRHWGSALEEGVQQPYLFIGEVLIMPTAVDLSSAQFATRYEAMMDKVDYTNLAKHLRAHGGLQVTIEGAEHPNFSDDCLRSPLRRYSGGGPIDALHAHDILNGYVLAFFEQTLNGVSSALLTADSHVYPEVRVDVYTKSDRVRD